MQTVINDWMHAVGFEGNGPAPPMPDEIRVAAAKQLVLNGVGRLTGLLFDHHVRNIIAGLAESRQGFPDLPGDL